MRRPVPGSFEALAIGLLLFTGLIDARLTVALALALIALGLVVVGRGGRSPGHQR